LHYYDFRTSLQLGGEFVARSKIGRTQDATILVLTSLAEGPKHGYALIKDIEAMSGEAMGPGTLYGVLARLEQEGLVEAIESEDRRRPYRLTGAGVVALRERLETITHVAKIGLRRLGTS
jgi:DNA-binding PadR family transcriptional regulator